MKSTILFILLVFGMGLIQCETNNHDTPERIPPEDWIKGVWRSEYNDSVKFISDTKVYMNSILYYYYFGVDSIKLRSFCNDILCLDREETYKSYKYEFDIKEDQFIIYDFCNTYPPCDPEYFFYNSDTALFTKSDEEIYLPFEEWIQGVWVNPKTDEKLLFSRPMKCEKVYGWGNFCKNGIFFGGNSINSDYVFTKDSLRFLYIHFSSRDAYFSFRYELDIENDLLMLFNYNLSNIITPDTAKFYKQLDL